MVIISVTFGECQLASGSRSPKWILNARSALVQFLVFVQAGTAFWIAR
jgi:hypothetical protein